MTELRQQLGATMPDASQPIVDENRVPTLDFWRVIERLVAMNAVDETFINEVFQNTDRVDVDELKTLIALLQSDVNAAIDAANQASQAAGSAP